MARTLATILNEICDRYDHLEEKREALKKHDRRAICLTGTSTRRTV